MTSSVSHSLSRTVICLFVTFSGLAALSWEVLWQIKASLALGVSAWGTAITLAATMGGMSLGAFLVGQKLKSKNPSRPVALYGFLEIIIGCAGLCLGLAFRQVEALDTFFYAQNPALAPLTHLVCIIAALGIPTFCMGATLPVLGLVARQFDTYLVTLYGLNTLGAASGSLMTALYLIPQFGITQTTWILAALNIGIGLFAQMLDRGPRLEIDQKSEEKTAPLPSMALWLTVGVTGFATFALEVDWFRSLTAAFRSTTDAFAIMLASVLLSLGLAARLVPVFKRRGIALSSLLGGAGILILLSTPLLERFDLFSPYINLPSGTLITIWFTMSVAVLGPPLLLLGTALPWILDDQNSSRSWGWLYACNTCAAVFGALAAGWVFLPHLGFARTAWMIGVLVILVGMALRPRLKLSVLALSCAALLVAIVCESGIGRTRIQGHFIYDRVVKAAKILEFYEGPESTVSAIEYTNGGRSLVVDGFVAAGQLNDPAAAAHFHYMPWMGHLPMAASPDPKNALVICFGTGQTANAVRQENPATLDIVDINPRVFKLAHNFTSNQHVLDDPRVTATVMDGRAFLRRTTRTFDVITLEPMPPNFAGVNALYSREFYVLAHERLTTDGMIAQWMPFLNTTAFSNASIARTFQSVFPNAVLWVDPVSRIGILLGSKDDRYDVGTAWPGYDRHNITRDLTESQVRNAVTLDRNQVARYGLNGHIITDDNQLLAYGKSMAQARLLDHLGEENFNLIKRAKSGAP